MNTPTDLSALDAALKVLEDAGTALHYQKITKRVLAAELWKTEGKTPDATINARLAVDVKKGGNASAFRRAGRGIFALNTERTDPTPRPDNIVKTEEDALYVRGPKAGEALSFTGAAERILEAAGKPGRMLAVPAGVAFALTYILRRRSCSSMGAFIISPPPFMLPKELQTAGPLRPTDVTSLPRYYRPVPAEEVAVELAVNAHRDSSEPCPQAGGPAFYPRFASSASRSSSHSRVGEPSR